MWSRDSGIFELKPVDTQQGIFNAQLNVVQKEHVIVFDDKSVFGDIIYDQEAGYRQDRLKLIGFKTTEWDGDLYSPGFIVKINAHFWERFEFFRNSPLVPCSGAR